MEVDKIFCRDSSRKRDEKSRLSPADFVGTGLPYILSILVWQPRQNAAPEVKAISPQGGNFMHHHWFSL